MATATLSARPAGGSLRAPWLLAGVVVLLQVAYPLVHGRARDVLTVTTVVVFCAASVAHALASRGVRYAALLVAVAGLGGFAAEALGVHTGVPFGRYAYGDSLGPRLLGVPVVVPLAWTMMAHPAVCVASRLARSRALRVAVAAWALAAWDLFLDPQMVAAGHWRWVAGGVHLPGVADVPLTNFGGWLLVAATMAAVLVPLAGEPRADRPAWALYLWTWAGSLVANLAFFGRPWVALWGGLGMGLVAVPLLVSARRR